MRVIFMLLAAAALLGCDKDDGGGNTAAAVEATPAVFTFDGAQASDPAAIRAHGERLTHILGCTGCHTPSLEGQLFNEDTPELGRIYASNLTRVLPTLTDSQLESLMRTGVHPTRGDLWIMPSEVLQRLSGPDMKALIAYLRTIKPSGEPTPPPMFTAKGKAEVASGRMQPETKWVAEFKTLVPPTLEPAHAYGRYLASVTCSECHNGDLTGIEDFEPGVNTPDLNVAGTYSNAELSKLLTTGKGRTGRDLGLMSLVGKGHFSYLTPRERDAIIAYVKARAERH